jgi:chromosome segregation ATPase
MSVRNQALVSILERLADEMKHQYTMLDDMQKQQWSLCKSVDSTERQQKNNLLDLEKSNDKLFDSINRYRSDMLSLVNEQDHINKNIDELRKSLKSSTYTLDLTIQKLTDVDARLVSLEKASQNHFEHALKQPDVFQGAIDNTNRNFTRLHSDTEKNLGELHRETARQLDKFQSETTRRLLLLDSIVTSLQTLLVRTEPPERKTPWIKRVFGRVTHFFRFRLPPLLKGFYKKVFRKSP